MDSLVSKVIVPAAIILMISATLSSAIVKCDVTKQYPVQDKFNKTVWCERCRPCNTGLEPERLCGSIIGIDDIIGLCKPCMNGTYSAKDDILPCKTCRSAKCFEHQIVEGTCPTDKDDTSYCLDKCEEGHVMNKERTACEVYKQQNTTKKPATKEPTAKDSTTGNPTTNYRTTNSTTTKNLVVSGDQTDKNSDLSPAVIAVLAISVFVGVVVIILIIWLSLKKSRTTDPRGKDDEELTCTELLPETITKSKEEMDVKFSKEETGSKETGLPTVNDVLHFTETTGGYADSTPTTSNHASPSPQNPTVSDVIAGGTNLYISSTPPPPIGYDFANEMPVQSPAMVLAPLPQRVVPVRITWSPSMYILNNFNNPDPMRVGGLPLTMYDKICETFDGGPDGIIDWRALAAWLDLSVNDVKRIERKERKTHNVIQTWETEAGNDIDKFVQILVDHKMTYLAGEINNAIRTRRA